MRRTYKNFDMASFRADLGSSLYVNIDHMDVDQMTAMYDTTLISLLDTYAPLKQFTY